MKLSQLMRTSYVFFSITELFGFKLANQPFRISKSGLAVNQPSASGFNDCNDLQSSSHVAIYNQLIGQLMAPVSLDNQEFDKELDDHLMTVFSDLEKKLSDKQLPPLFSAIKAGDLDLFQSYFDNQDYQSILATERDNEGNSPVHFCLIVKSYPLHIAG
jgi:hypothetical protein